MSRKNVDARCPYCQAQDLTRLSENDVSLVIVYRCTGCGAQFNVEPVRDADEPPEEIALIRSQQ